MIYEPQPGFQEAFVAADADITIGGGKAGVGKSFAILLDPLQYIFDKTLPIKHSKLRGVFFRRSMPEITNPGGLWDEAMDLYPHLGADMLNHRYLARFPNGAQLKFTHLQREATKENHKGGQYTFIYFDELPSFSRSQFLYLLSRNRSAAGVPPFTKCTTNPVGFGWVKELVQWYLYPDNYKDKSLAGYPIPDRIGVMRYFMAYNNQLIWGDSYKEVAKKVPEDSIDWDLPMESQMLSFTFIPGELEDNKFQDPAYRAMLNALPAEDKVRLLYGCWKAYEDPESLYKSLAISDLWTNDFIPAGGRRYLTVDIAFSGADKFVLMAWEGWRVIDVLSIPKSEGDEVVDAIENMARFHGIPASRIAYDSAGVGMFLKGFLRNAIPYHAGAAPLPPLGGKRKENYHRIRDQLYYRMASRVNNAGQDEDRRPYGVYFEPECWRDMGDKDLFEAELRAVFRKPNKTGIEPLAVNPKEEIKALIGRSPDYSEAFILRELFELEVPARARKPKTQRIARTKARPGD